MDKLQELLNRCKCGVFITVNEHRDYYQTAEESLKEEDERGKDSLEIEPEIRAKMIETNTIINLHFYPETPIGFYEIFHYDLDAALTQALECLRAG